MRASPGLLLILIAACGSPGAGDDVAGDDAPDVDAATAPDAEPGLAPLQLGIMVHVETQQAWQGDLSFFTAYMDRIRDEFLPRIAAHGARFTWEFRGEILQRIVETDDPILDELLAAGQGLGVHADKGYPASTQTQLTAELVALHDQFAAVNPVAARHVSGICSSLDWVTAAADAGFELATGNVSYCALSLDDPPAEYAGCTTPSLCHDVFPDAISERTHPWRAADGATWLDDAPAGRLIILPSSGGLVCAAEEAAGQAGNCQHTAADTPLFMADLDAAIAAREPDRLSTYYASWSYGAVLDDDVTEAWLTALDAYVSDGRVTWATFAEMQDAYEAAR